MKIFTQLSHSCIRKLIFVTYMKCIDTRGKALLKFSTDSTVMMCICQVSKLITVMNPEQNYFKVLPLTSWAKE